MEMPPNNPKKRDRGAFFAREERIYQAMRKAYDDHRKKHPMIVIHDPSPDPDDEPMKKPMRK